MILNGFPVSLFSSRTSISVLTPFITSGVVWEKHVKAVYIYVRKYKWETYFKADKSFSRPRMGKSHVN
jgi:hypothetical protein